MRLRNYSECPSETARNASGSSRPLRLCRPNLVPSSARQAFFHHSAVMWDGPAIKARRQRHGGAGILERPREPALTRIAALRLWIAGLRAPASPPTCENIRDSAKDWRTCSQPAPLTSVRIDSRLGSFLSSARAAAGLGARDSPASRSPFCASPEIGFQLRGKCLGSDAGRVDMRIFEQG